MNGWRLLQQEVWTATRFGIVGMLATALHIAVALALVLKSGAGVWVANVGGFCAAVSLSLAGQHYWVFSSRRALRETIAPFALVALAGFACNNLIVWAMTSGISASEPTALIAAALVTAVATFAINRMAVF